MGKEVIFSRTIEIYLDELLIQLFEKGYFGFPNTAKKYVDLLILYTEKYVGILPGKKAPIYFVQYGSNLKYITYQANKRTTWYIFYQERGDVFLIRHITNNHVAAQYFV
jgi:hypothetical protein